MSELHDASNPLDLAPRIGNSQGVVTITLAATTTLIHRVKFNATADIVKIYLVNRGAAFTYVDFGNTVDGTTATAFTKRMPSIPVIVQGYTILDEQDIVRLFEHFNSTTNILAQITVASTVDVSLEVREGF